MGTPMPTWDQIRGWTPILMFHEVLPDDTAALPPYAVTQSRLRAVLADFTRRGYRPGTLQDVVAGLDGGGPPHGRRLVLTFDDGTRDFFDYALPVLQEFDFTATLFIVAGLVGRTRSWHMPGDGGALPPVPLLTAGQLRDLVAAGFVVGAHTMTHPVLPTLSSDQAQREIAGSRATLQSMLGRPVEWFAYPYVALTSAIQAQVRDAGYWGACGGYHHPHSRYHLARIDGSVFTVPQLRLRTSGLFYWTRRFVRQARLRTPARAA